MNNNGENNMNDEPKLISVTEAEDTNQENDMSLSNTNIETETQVEEKSNEKDTAAPIEEKPIVNDEPIKEEKISKKELKRLKKEEEKQERLRLEQEKLELKRQEIEAKKAAKEAEKVRRSPFMYILLLLITIVLAGYTVYSSRVYKARLSKMSYECTPITTNKKEEQLDINSTLVQSLYKKVYTNIKEDLAQPEWNNTMKLYLAYRQIPTNEKYESNCNMFSRTKMEPYYCEETASFTPHAFKQESLILQFKKLFGEETKYQLDNIKLQNSCIGGYQYIPEREEFVEGICSNPSVTPLKVKKTLKEAKSYRNTIILVEEVKYSGSDKVEMPDYLKSGTYYYTFRLDMNYNFVLISKTLNNYY